MSTKTNGAALSSTRPTQQVKVADEVWVVTALLHRAHPKREDFSVEEIVKELTDRAERGTGEPMRPGIRVHVNQHCVANRLPNPARYRMLYETAPGRRRLFKTGDTYHPAREGAKIVPLLEELPHKYRELLAWYQAWDAAARKTRVSEDPILALVGSGRHIWGDENPDEYVRSLREGWE